MARTLAPQAAKAPLYNQSYAGWSRIEEQIINTASSSVTFSNIPQNYRHLQVVGLARSDQAAVMTQVVGRFNGDSGTNYDIEELVSSAGSVSASQATAQSGIQVGYITAASSPANFADALIFWTPHFTGSTFYKVSYSQCSVNQNGSYQVRVATSFWKNTAAVTQLVLTTAAGNFVVGSVFSLYVMR